MFQEYGLEVISLTHTLAEEEDVFRRILGTNAKIGLVQFSLG
jgi:hypothetical protein